MSNLITSNFTYKDEADVKARIEAAFNGVRLLPPEPLGIHPTQLLNLHPFVASHDAGMLQGVAAHADSYLKNVPARCVASSPLDRAGMLYGITIVFIDADSNVHQVELDMTKTTDTLNMFEARLIAVAQQMAIDFAEAYYKHTAANVEPVIKTAPSTDPPTPAGKK